MDLHMPVLDGHDAIASIRRLEARHHARPGKIFALSADAQSEAARTALANGADGFLTKPVAPAQLIAILRGLRPARS
jgi:CheY-like chemotaxis protein